MKTPVYSGLGAGQECREVEFEMDVLSFEGLCLRPLEDRDAPAFAQAARESWATVGPWLPWCHADYTEEEALAWFASCRASRRVEGSSSPAASVPAAICAASCLAIWR